jgi:hypothetical protein
MSFKRILLIFSMLLLSSALVSCGYVNRQAFNKASNQDIKTIGLLEVNFSDEFVFQHPIYRGPQFGGVAGLMISVDTVVKSRQLTSLMKNKKLDLRQEVSQALIDELEKTGYRVRVIEPTEDTRGRLVLDKDIDAYIKADIEAGYGSNVLAQGYMPTLRLTVKLIRADSREAVYVERVSYGMPHQQDEGEALTADAEYYFADYNVLEANADKAVKGLRQGIAPVVTKIAYDLARN